MPIINVGTRKDEYRVYAEMYSNTNQMSGRGNDEQLTQRISRYIFNKLIPFIEKDFNILDFGCGNGELLRIINKEAVNDLCLTGTSPTVEEVVKLISIFKGSEITFMRLESKNIKNLKKKFNIIIANSVLLLMNDSEVMEFLSSSHDKLEKNGLLYLGEVPELDELDDKTYGDSILKWILYVFKTSGYKEAIQSIFRVLICIFTKEIFMIAPKNLWYMEKDILVEIVEKIGFKLMSEEINSLYPSSIRDRDNFRRRDYLFQKTS